jgi:hypothetical protein
VIAERAANGRPRFLRAVELGGPERVEWVWKGRIPRGMLTLLAGEGGHGKSTLALELAARLSRGELEGDLAGRRAVTLFASAEDHVRATLLPRLMAAGGDLELVEFMVPGHQHPTFVFPDDVEEVRQRATERQAVFVVIDPFVAFLPDTVNSWRDQDVRRALAPLAQLAEAQRLAAFPVLHLNKGQYTDFLRRIGGTPGFVNAARSVLGLAPDPDRSDHDGPEKVLVHAKCNVGPLRRTLAYRVEGREVEYGDTTFETSRIVCLGESVTTAEDMLADAEERTARAEAVEFLEQRLTDGPREQKYVVADAEEVGISTRTLERAKRKRGVRSIRPGGRGPWLWELPDPLLSIDDGGGLGDLGGLASLDGQGRQGRHIQEDGDLGSAPAWLEDPRLSPAERRGLELAHREFVETGMAEWVNEERR